MSAHREKRNPSPRVRRAESASGSTRIRRVLFVAPRAVILLLAAFGLLFGMLVSYRVTALTARAVWTAILFVLLFSIVYSVRRRGILLLLLLFVAALFTWRNWEALSQGFLLLLEQALTPLSL